MTKNEMRLAEIAAVIASVITGFISGLWGFVMFFALGTMILCFDALCKAVRD